MSVLAQAGGSAATLAGAFVLLASAAQGGARVDPMLASMGKPYFEAYCISCHGPTGRGSTSVARARDVGAADLTRIAARRGGTFPDGDIAKFIDGRFDRVDGAGRVMPVWGSRLTENVPEAGLGESLARGKITVLVEYLKSIQTSDTARDVDE